MKSLTKSEDDLNPKWTTFGASGTSTTETLTLGDAYVNAYDVILNTDTDEMILVETVSSTSITACTRGWGTSTAAVITSGDTVHIIGSAFEEGAALSEVAVMSTKTTRAYNYTQIFRKKVEITGTLEASDLYGGNDRQYQIGTV